ncbi:hypothetical protein ACVI1J_003301 [Bradyrhizobium diazoefficiens]
MAINSRVTFLPGVPAAHILDRLVKAGGNEVASGKLLSSESSAALAVNAFGWFVERPNMLPAFPSFAVKLPAKWIEIEYCARFPWNGGRHPWLDAVIETDRHLMGVESKRFEPFRDKKIVSLSTAYDRDVWGARMAPFARMRDILRAGDEPFHFLDAAQLVKHAFGLVTDGKRRAKSPILVYIFAEPKSLNGKDIDAKMLSDHRAEVTRFANRVRGAEVSFHALSYRDWLRTWPSHGPVGKHRIQMEKRFAP